LPGRKKIKRPTLVISSFKKGQILKNEKRPNKGQIFNKKCHKILEICSDLSKTGLKMYCFCQHSKKARSGKEFQKRPNGNPGVIIKNMLLGIIGFCSAMVMVSSFLRAQKSAIKLGFNDDINTYIFISGTC
jgi:hypothetical protein